MIRRLLFPGFVLLLGLFVETCSKAPEPAAQVPDLAGGSASPGEMIFQTRCFVCHGRGGKGDGPASTGLGATVRDLTSPALAVGGTAAMAPNPDLSDAQIDSLTLYIRGLRKK